MKLYRLLALFLLASFFQALESQLAQAQSGISFPWGCDSGRSKPEPMQAPAPVYRTLGKTEGRDVSPQPIVLQPTPSQQVYAYGWFGSNPSPIWSRHFGVNKSYTQWTRR